MAGNHSRAYRSIHGVLALVLVLSCAGPRASLSVADSARVAREIEQRVRSAYDLSAPNVEQRMLDLYPASGRVVSAATGHVVTSADSVKAGVRYFWRQVGTNMQDPKWMWDQIVVDVLSPTSAVMTAGYHIPHRTPRGDPHVLGGAWTAVFERRDGKWVIVQEHLSDLPPEQAAAAHDSMPGMKH
jgi:hypothetical protein